MKNDIFNQAKELKEKYNALYTYRNKLSHAKGCSLSEIKLEYTVGPYNRKDDLYFRNKGLMNEAIEKEIELVTIELDELQKQFDEL
jgi:hypothetical protein